MNSKVWGTVYLPFLLLSFTGIMASLHMHLHFGIRGTAFLLLKHWYHFRLCHKEDELLNMPASLFPSPRQIRLLSLRNSLLCPHHKSHHSQSCSSCTILKQNITKQPLSFQISSHLFLLIFELSKKITKLLYNHCSLINSEKYVISNQFTVGLSNNSFLSL